MDTQAVNPPQNMAYIQGGTFLMGSPVSEPERSDNEIQHQVTVSSFYMGKYEVTQREWVEVMGTNPSNLEGDNLPVGCVSWYEAIEYCNKRSEKEGLTPAYRIDKSRSDPNNKSEDDDVRWAVTWDRSANGYRLPTEAEWEYGCRAGTTTPFNTGNTITMDQANYEGGKTTEVGSFAPNPWGLYDMHGNVWEWCWDWYGAYSTGSQTDPTGASSGSARVNRGGSWYSVGRGLRSALRGNDAPSAGSVNLGFRVVRPLVSAGGTADTRSEMPDQSQGNKQETDTPFVSPDGTDSPPVNPSQNMVRIQGGTFLMGSPSSEPDREDNEIQHQVTVSSFYMGKYEVTQREWVEVMGNNPSHFQGDNLPVEQVSWYDAVNYCNALSRKEGLIPAYTVKRTLKARSTNGYRLPTEAEWEYACRAGTTTPFSTGNNITTDQANYIGCNPYNNNPEGEDRQKTTEVESFAPNPWGLYDMHGNVLEWCWDWYGDYSAGSQTDPTGASSGSYRVFRSGYWNGYEQGGRSAFRSYSEPSNRLNYLGFRVARN